MFNDEPDYGQMHSIYGSETGRKRVGNGAETERKKCEPSLLFEKDSGFCLIEKGSARPERAIKDFWQIPKHLLSLSSPVCAALWICIHRVAVETCEEIIFFDDRLCQFVSEIGKFLSCLEHFVVI